MRKLFRFKYEPCNGTCYAPEAPLATALNAYSHSEKLSTVSKMVEAHDKLCDNPDFSYGVDLDEKTGVFVGFYRSPDQTELFNDLDFKALIDKLWSHIMTQSIPQKAGLCEYGTNGEENLGRDILDFCLGVVKQKAA